MRRTFFLAIFSVCAAATVLAADPMSTSYTMEQCEGSLTPYPVEVRHEPTPDSLTAVYISHVGRHGARYPASSANCVKLQKALEQADSLGTITALGKELKALNERVMAASHNRWGALDSLGMAEQRAIATRMMRNYPGVFEGGTVNALSSYSPRAMMSMYSFVHQLDRMNNKVNYLTTTGRMNSALMRPFDVDQDYLDFRKEELWKPAYKEYFDNTCPLTAITRVLGRDYPYGGTDEARDLAITEYYVVAGLQAMEMESEMTKYFTKEEANALWSCFNLRQYLQRTATTVSTVPADIASDLILNIITGIDNAIEGTNPASVDLRFGHAETVMPLVSLMHLPGCYYMTNYFDTVGQHWRDFDVVPMASNVQIILFKSKKSNRFYVRTDLNEEPVSLIANDSRIYVPWGEARNYLMKCIPLYRN